MGLFMSPSHQISLSLTTLLIRKPSLDVHTQPILKPLPNNGIVNIRQNLQILQPLLHTPQPMRLPRILVLPKLQFQSLDPLPLHPNLLHLLRPILLQHLPRLLKALVRQLVEGDVGAEGNGCPPASGADGFDVVGGEEFALGAGGVDDVR